MKYVTEYCLTALPDEKQLKVLAARARKEAAMYRLYENWLDKIEQMDDVHFQIFYSELNSFSSKILKEMNL